MTIIRAAKPVVAISRAMIENHRLSWGARGLMAFIESQPDGYWIDSGALASESREAYGDSLVTAQRAARDYLAELIEAGYLEEA